MDNITIFEFLLVGAIVLIQTSVGLRTYNKIKVWERVIPSLDFFKIEKFNIPISDLRTLQPKDILSNLPSYVVDNEEEAVPDEGVATTEISLINPNKRSNTTFEGLLWSINVYLLRNKGATTDFNLIKDIIERNVDTEDDGISQTVTIPLYLGLMGTMVGIVFGLINLYLVSESGQDFEVQGFLLGVSIAMFASFYGLGWTVFNASFNHKKARTNVELAKNNFYTFIQTELLPILNQSVSSSVHQLHGNLIKFNEDFALNINNLSGLLNKNYDAIKAQDRILQKLDNIDIAKFVTANLDIMKELSTGTEKLEKFNQYLGAMDSINSRSLKLSNSFESLLSKTNNFKDLAEKLDARVDQSNKLVQFLNDHFEVIQNRGDLINDSVLKVDDVLMKSLVALQEHTQAKIDIIKEMSIKEEDLMMKSFAENRGQLAKLSFLEEMTSSLKELKNTVKTGNAQFREDIDRLNTSINKISSRRRSKDGLTWWNRFIKKFGKKG